MFHGTKVPRERKFHLWTFCYRELLFTVANFGLFIPLHFCAEESFLCTFVQRNEKSEIRISLCAYHTWCYFPSTVDKSYCFVQAVFSLD